MLRVTDGRIVDDSGAPVQLRGTCVGGWMNSEIDRVLESFAFRNCLPREELLEVLRPRLGQRLRTQRPRVRAST